MQCLKESFSGQKNQKCKGPAVKCAWKLLSYNEEAKKPEPSE